MEIFVKWYYNSTNVVKGGISLNIQTSCCFTGHRIIPTAYAPQLYASLNREIEQLVKTGYRDFLAGGALGFDTMAAKAVLDLKNKYPIRLVLILPCENQCHGWSLADKQMYNSILNSADSVFYASDQYTRDCMHKRNRMLVDNSSVCIAYMTKPTGGTAYTVNYAQNLDKKIIRL